MESKILEWNKSYERGENHILYPQTEVVRFFFRKIKNDSTPRVLDFACGIGTHTNFFAENDCICTGTDISDVALNKARELYGHNKKIAFDLIDSEDQKLRYRNKSFDYSIAESCLDSMPFEFANRYLNELVRVTKKGIFFSLISSKVSSFVGERTVETLHELGTIQSYFDLDLIGELINGINYKKFDVHEVVITNSQSSDVLDGRYYCYLELS